jgi:crotonobetainyl-CoA:carnitine CoA-transferase CaiB-like acyl-CoA transferase
VVPNFQIGDLLGGALAPLVGLLAAVIDARASGRGRQVDVAMTDAVFAHAVFPLAGLLARLAPPPRGADLLSGGVPCYGVYATADGRHMAVGALEKKFWELLCDTLGRPDLKPFHLAFGAKGEQAKRELAAVFAGQPQSHWIAVFDRVDCCVTPVLHHRRGARQRPAAGARHGGRGRRYPPVRAALEALRPRLRDRARRPAPGQHSAEILREAGFGRMPSTAACAGHNLAFPIRLEGHVGLSPSQSGPQATQLRIGFALVLASCWPCISRRRRGCSNWPGSTCSSACCASSRRCPSRRRSWWSASTMRRCAR